MYKITNQITAQENRERQVLPKNPKNNILNGSFEKDADFPENSSSVYAQLIILEHAIVFQVNNIPRHLKAHQYFSFFKQKGNKVEAKESSNFFIVQ